LEDGLHSGDSSASSCRNAPPASAVSTPLRRAVSGARHEGRMPNTSETNDWAKVIDRLPFVGALKRDLMSLRHYLVSRRPARICAVGTPGSGRSAIANALLN